MQGEARLARAAGSGQRHQAGAGGPQQRDNLGHLAFPPQEGGRLGGQVVRPGLQRVQRREGVRQVGVEELEDTFGFEQIGEAVFT